MTKFVILHGGLDAVASTWSFAKVITCNAELCSLPLKRGLLQSFHQSPTILCFFHCRISRGIL